MESLGAIDEFGEEVRYVADVFPGWAHLVVALGQLGVVEGHKVSNALSHGLQFSFQAFSSHSGEVQRAYRIKSMMTHSTLMMQASK